MIVSKKNKIVLMIILTILLALIFMGNVAKGLDGFVISEEIIEEEFNFEDIELDGESDNKIRIINAEHLDKDKNFIANIYDEVYQLDDFWKTIEDGEYVRVTFEQNLTNENDITIFLKVIEGDPIIDVYENNREDIIAKFADLISDEYNKVYLTSLQGTQDVFDLRVVGGRIEIDYIVDPRTLTDNFITPNQSSMVEGDQVTLNASYDAGGSGGAALWHIGLNNSDTGHVINTSCTGAVFQIVSIDLSSCTRSGGESCTDNGDGTVNVSLKSTDHNIVWNLSACSGSSSFSPANVTTYVISSSSASTLNDLTGAITITAPTETVPPNVTINQPLNQTYITTTIDFNVTAVDNEGMGDVLYTLNGGLDNFTMTNASTSPTYWNATNSTMAQGSHTVIYYANDINNNLNWTENVTFFIDSINPVVNIVIPSNNSNSSNNLLDVNFTVVDSNRESCWFSNDTFSANTTLASCGNITSVVWSEGQHNVTIWANDSAGNEGQNGVSFTIDTTIPTITIATPSNNTNTTDTLLDVNFTVTDTYLESCWFSNDTYLANTTLASCGNITSVVWSEGQHNVTVWANDSAGNEGRNGVSFTIDTIAPAIQFTNQTIFDNESLDHNINATDSGVGVESFAINWTNTFNITISTGFLRNNSGLSIANYSIELTVNDTLGNTNTTYINIEVQNSTIPAETINPNVTINQPLNQNYTTTTIEFNVTAVDETGMDDVYYTLNGGVDNFTMTNTSTSPTYWTASNTTMAQGPHTVIYYANDTSNNLNNSENVTFFIDSINPAILIETPSNNTNTSDTSIDVNFSVSDTNLESCWWSNDSFTVNNSITCGQNITGVNWSEGIHNVTVYANDSTNNENHTSVSFTIDTTNPVVTIVTPSNNTNSSDILLDVNFTVSDSGSGVESCWFSNDTFSVNTTLASCGNITGVVWTEGQHNVTVYTNDSVGNEGRNSVTFRVDITNPEVNLLGPVNASTYDSLTVNFAANFTDLDLKNATPYIWNSSGNLINDSENRTISGVLNETNISIILPYDDTFEWNYFVCDSADNCAFNITNWTVTIDSGEVIIPNVTINQPLNQNYTTNTIDFNVTAVDETGMDTVIYTLNGGVDNFTMSNLTTSPTEWTASNTTMAQGSHTVIYYANDTSDNLNNSETVTFFVDSITPVVTFVIPNNNSNTSNTNQNINFTITDTNLQTCWWSNDSMTQNITLACGTNVTNITWAEGQHNVTVYANDSLNNEGRSAITFIIDTIDPAIAISSPINNTNTTDTKLDVNFSVSDTNLDSCWWSNDTFTVNNSITCGQNITGVNWSEGIHNVTVYANDSANNENHTSISFTIDTTAPTLIFTNQTTLNNETLSHDINATDLYVSIESFAINWTTTFNITIGGGVLTNNSILAIGNYTINVSVNDTLGNLASDLIKIEVQDFVIPIDFSPNVTINQPLNQNYTTTTIDFNVTAIDDDDMSDVYYTLNGGADNFSMSNSTTSPTEWTATNTSMRQGSHTVIYYANDTSSNLNNSETVTFFIDSINPVLTIITPNNNSNSSNTLLDVNFTVSETNLDSCWFSNDTYSANITLASCGNITSVVWTEGQHNVTVYANDTLGNEGQNGVSFTIDTTGPTVTIVNPSNNTNSSDNLLDVNFTVGSDAQSCWYSNDTYSANITLASCGNITSVVWTEQQHNVTVYANDSVGNERQDSVSFTIDLSNPLVTINSPLTQNYTQLDVNITLNENGFCEYTLDGGLNNVTMTNNGDVDFNHTNSSIADGVYTLAAYCNDSLGNNNFTETVNFEIDNTNPLIDYTIGTPNNDTNQTNTDIFVNVTVTETNEDTIIFSLYYLNGTLVNSTSYTDATRSINFTGLSDGTYNYNVTVNDSVGNSNTTNSRTLRVDTTGPFINLIGPLNNSGDGDGNLSFVFNVTDVVGITNCSLSFEGSVNQTNTSILKGINTTFELNNLDTGDYNWSISCTDDFNHINSTSNRIFTVLNTYDFSGNTTDFSKVNISNISNLVIEKPDFGRINFSENVNLSGSFNINSHVNISSNRIDINSSALPALNKSARLRLYGLTFSDPRPLKDGVECPSTICTEVSYSGGTFVFDVTQFSVYSSEETPSSPSLGGDGGGGGGGTIISKGECLSDSQCDEDFSCFNNKCVKLFDVKIIRVDSPVPPGEFLDFTYFIKGMGVIEGDVIISFSLEKDNETVASGSDTIYLGVFEEKTETTNLFLPSDLQEGTYNFYIEVDFQGHKTKSNRVVEVNKDVPLDVDINLINLPKENLDGIFDYSFILAFNRDLSVPVEIKQEIRKNGKTVWLKETELEITKSLILEENVGKLKAGNYELEIIVKYNGKESRFLQEFAVSGVSYDFDIKTLLVIIVILMLLYILGRRSLKSRRRKKEKFLKAEILEIEEVLKELEKPGKAIQEEGKKKFSKLFSELERYFKKIKIFKLEKKLKSLKVELIPTVKFRKKLNFKKYFRKFGEFKLFKIRKKLKVPKKEIKFDKIYDKSDKRVGKISRKISRIFKSVWIGLKKPYKLFNRKIKDSKQSLKETKKSFKEYEYNFLKKKTEIKNNEKKIFRKFSIYFKKLRKWRFKRVKKVSEIKAKPIEVKKSLRFKKEFKFDKYFSSFSKQFKKIGRIFNNISRVFLSFEMKLRKSDRLIKRKFGDSKRSFKEYKKNFFQEGKRIEEKIGRNFMGIFRNISKTFKSIRIKLRESDRLINKKIRASKKLNRENEKRILKIEIRAKNERKMKLDRISRNISGTFISFKNKIRDSKMMFKRRLRKFKKSLKERERDFSRQEARIKERSGKTIKKINGDFDKIRNWKLEIREKPELKKESKSFKQKIEEIKEKEKLRLNKYSKKVIRFVSSLSLKKLFKIKKFEEVPKSEKINKLDEIGKTSEIRISKTYKPLQENKSPLDTPIETKKEFKRIIETEKKLVKEEVVESEVKEETSLKNVIGLRVYSLDNIEIGKISDAYVIENKIKGWIIKLDGKIKKTNNGKYIILDHNYIYSIGDKVILKSSASNYFL